MARIVDAYRRLDDTVEAVGPAAEYYMSC
jgi:hypothetical protein